jgi:PLD-like domain
MRKAVVSSADVRVVAHRGDAKTLLAFDLLTEVARENFAGFTVHAAVPAAQPVAYFLLNTLGFERPADHAQVPEERATSTVNAPYQKFRWVHVPGSAHQGLEPVYGPYQYEVTPRYFDGGGSMLPLDAGKTVAVKIAVGPFETPRIKLGFTRGFKQSQAFVSHFGLKARIRPNDAELQFDTSQVSGGNALGQQYTYQQQYEWLGFTARKRIFDILDAVRQDGTLRLDVFAYDLNEPDLIAELLALAEVKRVRVILDNSSLHHNATQPKPEDQFEVLFNKAAGSAKYLRRGKFSRYSHDKVFIVYKASDTLEWGDPVKALAGSTNFSVTGLYVNSNHVLVFEDDKIAGLYARAFQLAWDTDVTTKPFAASSLSRPAGFSFGDGTPQKVTFRFSPHTAADAATVLGGIVQRIADEKSAPDDSGSVLFAVMELGGTGSNPNPVYQALNELHESGEIFSYGISDDPPGIALYGIGQAKGVLVTGKPVGTKLPLPFSQVPNLGGAGHQVHDKFIVCGFNGPDPTAFCGSSNLALGGETENGDNLIEIHDPDIAAVFAIEALTLVDHFNFLGHTATKGTGAPPPADQQQAARDAGMFLHADGDWVHKYFDRTDMHCKDRELFAR